MTAPKLAATRPAALTGRVGQGGENRVHDVALVQALLGLKRAKGGRMYLSGDHVTGKLDRVTAEALMRFRLDQRDANIRQPLARSGPLLNKLAQGQSLAVLEATATPYKLATLAEPGPIRGLKAKELGAARTTELMQVMKDFTRDWGIAFDVEVTRAPGHAHAFVARFTPRHFSVHNGRRQSPVMSNAVFRGIAKELHDALAADLQARCAEAFQGPSRCEDSAGPQRRPRLRRTHRTGGRRSVRSAPPGGRPKAWPPPPSSRRSTGSE
jgi:hypothetical protein